MGRRFLYVMDPMTKVLVDKDTTFAFQLEGERRGHEQYHCLPDDLLRLVVEYEEILNVGAAIARGRKRAGVHDQCSD